MSSLQEALKQRKSKIEKTVATKASASGKKKSKVRRRAEPVPPRPEEHPAHWRSFFRPKSSTSGTCLSLRKKINGATGQRLLHEAISDLFVKKGKKALQPPG